MWFRVLDRLYVHIQSWALSQAVLFLVEVRTHISPPIYGNTPATDETNTQKRPRSEALIQIMPNNDDVSYHTMSAPCLINLHYVTARIVQLCYAVVLLQQNAVLML